MPSLAGVLRALIILSVLLVSACTDSSRSPESLSYEPSNSASIQRARLLTADQYSASVAYIFGEDIAQSVVPPIPPTARVDGLTASGSALVGMSPDQLQQIQIASTLIASRVMDEDHRSFLLPCEPQDETSSDDICARSFLEKVGLLWFRRPLEEAALERYVRGAAIGAEQLEDFYAGLGLALEGMLSNPNALYVVDIPQDESVDGRAALDAYALASRLSFFLWNAPPDAVLLDAAATGAILEPGQRSEIVGSMINSPRIEMGIRAFFDDMLHFEDFNTLAKDAETYPALTGATLEDAREQTLRTIAHKLITEDADYRDLFTTRDTFISMDLAAVYGTQTTKGWQPYSFPEDGLRRGIISHVSFLAAHSHPSRSSATLRGKALRETFLCQTVPDPPPNVDFSNLEEPDESIKTARGRLRIHNENPSCAGCHKLMDPVGLAMENFDGGGQFRWTEDGAELDTTGDLDGVYYDDIRGLAVALRNHPSLPRCLVRRLYAFSTGGPLTGRADWPITDHFEAAFESDGYRVKALMETIALSEAFSHIRISPRPEDTIVAALELQEVGHHE